MLHIVLAHFTGGVLRQSSVPGRREILAWWDNPAIGPTPQTGSLEEMSRIRTRYMKKPLRFQYRRRALQRDLPSLAQRDRVLRRCGEWREVVLWFGPPAIEQFPMLQILAALGEQRLGKTRLTHVSSPGHAMGVYRPDELRAFFESRETLSKQHLRWAQRAWCLYCASNPMPLFRFAQENVQVQPFFCNALLRQIREYPSVFNGLSLSEEALLRHVENAKTLAHSVGLTLCDGDIGYLAGDYELFDAIWRFLHAPEPLIEPVEHSLSTVRSSLQFRNLNVRLTAAGRDVMAGRRDNIALNGIDRWIGGVHLKGKTVPYRWDGETGVLRARRRK